jgi:pyruvate-ferredoxin/flavodoxin oxidoreductase
MKEQLEHQKSAVASGYWNLYRFDPRRGARGENPLQIDSSAPDGTLKQFMASENRFNILRQSAPERAEKLAGEASTSAVRRRKIYETIG